MKKTIFLLSLIAVTNTVFADSTTELSRIISPSGDVQVRVELYKKDGVSFDYESVHIEPLISDAECKRRLGDRSARAGGFVYNGYKVISYPRFIIPTESGYAKHGEYEGYAEAGKETVEFILHSQIVGSKHTPIIRTVSDICYIPSNPRG